MSPQKWSDEKGNEPMGAGVKKKDEKAGIVHELQV